MALGIKVDGQMTKAQDRSVSVAIIVIARFLAERDPAFGAYLKESYEQAVVAGLSSKELALLKIISENVIS